MGTQILKQEIAGMSNPQKLVKRNPVTFDTQVDCAKLNTMMEENTGLPSMCPYYSKIQLRRIERLRVRRYKNGRGHGNIRRSSQNKTDVSSMRRLEGIANNVEALL
jgi:hypothetical protein